MKITKSIMLSTMVLAFIYGYSFGETTFSKILIFEPLNTIAKDTEQLNSLLYFWGKNRFILNIILGVIFWNFSFTILYFLKNDERK